MILMKCDYFNWDFARDRYDFEWDCCDIDCDGYDFDEMWLLFLSFWLGL